MNFNKYAFAILLILIFVLANALSFADDGRYKKKNEITITNLTGGQVFSPPIVTIHERSFRLFTLGDTASPGLALLAQESMPVDLISELNPAVND